MIFLKFIFISFILTLLNSNIVASDMFSGEYVYATYSDSSCQNLIYENTKSTIGRFSAESYTVSTSFKFPSSYYYNMLWGTIGFGNVTDPAEVKSFIFALVKSYPTDYLPNTASFAMPSGAINLLDPTSYNSNTVSIVYNSDKHNDICLPVTCQDGDTPSCTIQTTNNALFIQE